MKRVLVLSPRLDVMFKEGPVPKERGSYPPIRAHWANFVECVAREHARRGDSVHVLELPLWQFTPDMVEEIKPDIAYIPHKERPRFPISEGIDARYYMQSVFPWRFYVDSMGFAGGASNYPALSLLRNTPTNSNHFDELREYSKNNGSKFDQPAISGIKLPDTFVFFPCQIPHDETIKYHSNVTVERALEVTAQVCQSMNMPLIVKGHPVNPASMANLKEICAKYAIATWLDNVSIHEIIPKSKVVAVVNSGTGMEALLHLKPVITFGRCEYDVVTMNATDPEELKTMITLPRFDMSATSKFFNNWCDWTYDTKTPSDFNKLA